MTERLDPELSRIAFEDRLVQHCEDESLPLLERVRLLGVAASRMDTFFMTRIGRLKRLVAIGKRSHGLSSAQQLDRAAGAAHDVMARAYRLLEDQLLPALESHGIRIERWSDLSDSERRAVRAVHSEKLAACIRPLGVSEVVNVVSLVGQDPSLAIQITDR